MAKMPTFEEIRADFERGVRTAEQAIEHPFRHHQTPAVQPVNLAAAPAPAVTATEDTMSLATLEADLGQRVAAAEAAVHNEIGKLIADLPTLTADAKKLAGNPLAQVAITAGEHVISGILPPEAVAVLADGAAKMLDGLLGLYNPQGAQQAPAQQAAAAPAQ